MAKKSMLLVFVILSTILLIGGNNYGKAHVASNMSLIYNSTTKEVNVTITHGVADKNAHFIISVEIQVNGSTISTDPYTSQPTTGTFVYQYTNITASNGDTIKVIAICNIAGTISRSIIVGDPADPQSVEPGIPGYLGLWIIFASSTIALLTINYRRIRHMKK